MSVCVVRFCDPSQLVWCACVCMKNFWLIGGLHSAGWRMSTWGELPDVVLDVLLGRILPIEDIRSFYLVCKNWSTAVQKRPQVNAKRRALVNSTYINKENNEENVIAEHEHRTNPKKPDVDKKGSDCDSNSKSKPGTRQNLCRSVLRSSASSNASSTRSQGTPTQKPSSNRSTPKSRYLIQVEAARKLKDGEVLSPCPECRSPVPSPSPSRQNSVKLRAIRLADLKEEVETPKPEPAVPSPSNNQIIQYVQCQCPTCSYRFCSHCKCKEHPGKPCKEIDSESAFSNETDRPRNSKSSNFKSGRVLNRRKKNPNLRRTLL